MTTDSATVSSVTVGPPDRSDQGPAIQEAINAADGGTVHLLPGRYRVSTPITIPGANIHLRGEGGPWGMARNTWIDWNGEGALFSFADDTTKKNGFKVSGMLLYGHENTAFDLWTSSTFTRGLTFERVGMMKFQTALHVRRGPEGVSRLGDVLLRRCVIVDGGQAVDATEAWLNMFTIEKCTIVHNSPPDDRYVIDLHRPNVVHILRNSLEGQPRVLRAVDGHAVQADGNQYEGNGDVVWWIQRTEMHVGVEYYRRLASEPKDPPRFQFHGCTPSGLSCPDSTLTA